MNEISMSTSLAVAIAAAAIIELILKGFALWRAAKNNDQGWFIVLMVINTVGILPAIYLLFFSKKPAKK
jgi:uncharacterized membrane protein HdeD (DUF308 family)